MSSKYGAACQVKENESLQNIKHMMRDIILSTINKKRQQEKPEQKNTTQDPNIKQTKIWHGFDLLVEGKKGELVKMEILVKIKITSDFDFNQNQ